MVDFVFFQRDSIDAKLNHKDYVQANLLTMEQSEAFLQHKTQHKDAHLQFVATTKTGPEALKDEDTVAKVAAEAEQHIAKMSAGEIKGDLSQSYKSNDAAGQMMFAGCPCGAIFLAKFFGDSLMPDDVKRYTKDEMKAEETSYLKTSGLPSSGYKQESYSGTPSYK